MGIEYLEQKKKETERKDRRWACKTFLSGHWVSALTQEPS